MFWPKNSDVITTIVCSLMLLIIITRTVTGIILMWRKGGGLVPRVAAAAMLIAIVTGLWLGTVWLINFIFTATMAGGLAMIGFVICIMILASMLKQSLKRRGYVEGNTYENSR